MKEQQERSFLEICIELSMNEVNGKKQDSIPIILDGFNMQRQGLGYYEIVGKLYEKYMPNSYKVE